MKLYIVYNRESTDSYAYFVVKANSKSEANKKAYERCNCKYPLRCFDASLLEDCFNDEEKYYGWKDVYMIS